MKRKCKSWSEVTCYGANVRYEYNTRKWKVYANIKGPSCSHARFKTLKRAKKKAVALHVKYGCKVVLMHWSINKGIRLVREYTIGGFK